MKFDKLLLSILLFSFILSCSTFLFSDEVNSIRKKQTFLTLGLSPFNMHANLSFYNGKRSIALKYSFYGGFDIEGRYDIGIMYEIPLIKSRHWFVFVGGGFGFITLTYGDNEHLFNIPVEVRLFHIGSKNFGVGLFGLYNINKTESLDIGGGLSIIIRL